VDYRKKEITDKLIANLISSRRPASRHALQRLYRVILEQTGNGHLPGLENPSAKGMYYYEPE
jgi:hypothetical protein